MLTESQEGRRGRIHRGSGSQGYLGSGRRGDAVEMGLGARQHREMRRRPGRRQDRRPWVARVYLMMMMMMMGRRMGREGRKR